MTGLRARNDFIRKNNDVYLFILTAIEMEIKFYYNFNASAYNVKPLSTAYFKIYISRVAVTKRWPKLKFFTPLFNSINSYC